MSKEKTTSAGVSLAGLVFLVFLILKLVGIGQVANWSWWWVTSPLWLPFILVITISIVVYVISRLL